MQVSPNTRPSGIQETFLDRLIDTCHVSVEIIPHASGPGSIGGVSYPQLLKVGPLVLLDHTKGMPMALRVVAGRQIIIVGPAAHRGGRYSIFTTVAVNGYPVIAALICVLRLVVRFIAADVRLRRVFPGRF